MKRLLLLMFSICQVCFQTASGQQFPQQMRLSPDGRRLITGDVPSTGLYDQSVVREIHLNFHDPDFWDDLEDNYGSDDDEPATMIVDGVTYDDVGVRFKGNSSYALSNDEKKSFNISLDAYIDGQEIDGYSTLNLNNCHGDRSYMAEVFFETQISKHVPAPKGSFVHLFINGDDWGLYANVQQLNKDYLKEWFLSNDGALWRAERPPGSSAPNGRDGDSLRSLYYLGSNLSVYQDNYHLKFSDVQDPFYKLMRLTRVMDTVSDTHMENVLGNYLDIDRTLWFLAAENAFGDDDGYVFEAKSDYYFYLEAETGRFTPLEFDGNGAMDDDYENLSIFHNANKPNYALLYKLLNNPSLRQRYLAHMRTLINTSLDESEGHQKIDNFFGLVDDIVQNDPVANYSYSSFVDYVDKLKEYVTNRYDYISDRSDIDEDLPEIENTRFYTDGNAWQHPTEDEDVVVTAKVTSPDDVDKVTLYYATGLVGKFTKITMRDDGNHDDGASGDDIYGAEIPDQPAGTWVRFYIEARSDNSAKTVRYDPEGAEHDVYTYFVRPKTASNPKIVINEIMAGNVSTMADEAGEFDDWVELYNKSSQAVNVGRYIITDNEYNLDKWEIPSGTIIQPGEYLIVWLDEDESQGDMHANFKLSLSGEHLLLLDDDGELVDEVIFGQQTDDISYARVPNGTGAFTVLAPTFGANNVPVLNASFTANALQGCAPFTVSFTNHSVLATSYTWDFGDSTSSGSHSPSHTFTLPGNYTVRLIAGDGTTSDTATVSINVDVPLPTPVLTSGSRCGSGSVLLTASSQYAVNWYSSAAGGNLLHTGQNFQTPSISSSTVYYASSSDGTCSSVRDSITAIVVPQPAPPQTIDSSSCTPASLTLMAISPYPVAWYTSFSGGSPLSTSSAFVTPFLSSSATYYVETGTTCLSQRVPVEASIGRAPDPPVLSDGMGCGSGQVVLSGTADSRINWYDSNGNLLDTGYVFLTPSISATTTFYANAGTGCNSTTVPVQAFVMPLPSAPSVTGDSICGSGTLTLSAISPDSVFWYDSAVNDNLLFTGDVFVTPHLSGSRTYYAEAGDGCRSARVPVHATVSPVGQILAVQHGTLCGPGQVVLSVTSPHTVEWYDHPSGGSLLGGGNTFLTPVITSSQTYYAIAGGHCAGNVSAVNANILPHNAVNLGADTVFIYSGQTIMLDAGAGYDTYSWSTGDTVQSINVNMPGTYSVSVTEFNGCLSQDQVEVLLNVGVTAYEYSDDFTIYPNPSEDYITVRWNAGSGQRQIEIYSTDGRQVYLKDSNKTGLNEELISVRNLSSGIYFVRIIGESYRPKRLDVVR